MNGQLFTGKQRTGPAHLLAENGRVNTLRGAGDTVELVACQ